MSRTASSTERRRSWWTAGVAGMASYLDSGAIVTTGTALVLFQESFGITPGQFGQLSALLTVMIAVGAFIGGPLSDRFGRRRIFMLTIAMYAIGAAILAVAPSIAALYLGIFLIGFASGADLPPSLAMIAEAAPEGDEGKMITFSHVLWMAAIPVVNVFGIMVGDMAADGARIMYGHLLVVAVLVLLLRLRLPESPVWNKRKDAIDTGSVSRASLKGIFSKRYLPALLGVSLFYAVTNIAANTNGQFATYLYVNVAGATVQTASAMNMIGLVCSIAASFFLMGIVDTRWRMLGFVLGTIAAATAFMVPAIVGVTILTLVFMGVVYGVAGIVSGEPLFKVWSQELFPTEYRSTAQGLGIAFTRVVASGAALVTPGIIAYGPSVLFFFLSAVVLIAGLIGVVWVSRLPKVLQDEKKEDVEQKKADGPSGAEPVHDDDIRL